MYVYDYIHLHWYLLAHLTERRIFPYLIDHEFIICLALAKNVGKHNFMCISATIK